MRRLVVVGIGGFGRETADVIEALVDQGDDLDLVGMLDDQPSARNLELLAERDLTYLGSVDTWLATSPLPDTTFVIGIAHPGHRRAVDAKLTEAGLSPTTLVHPAATLGSRTRLGAGSIVCAGARLTTNITLGRHAHVHVNATIGHDTSLGDFASAYPASAVSGSCTIADGATVGANATVLQGLTVGSGALVGAGAVVTTDILSHSIVKGVPAR